MACSLAFDVECAEQKNTQEDMKYVVLHYATGMKNPAVYIHEHCTKKQEPCGFCGPISEELLLQYPSEVHVHRKETDKIA